MNTDEHGSKRSRMKRGGGVLATVMVLSLAGCSLPEAQPDLTRFYVLTPAANGGAAGAGGTEVRVFVKAVQVPEFLRGKLMQVRLAANEVDFVDTARWAEPLEAGVARVLRENLEAGGLEVVNRSVDERALDVVVHLKRCEGARPERVARLSARVEIYAAGLEGRELAEEEIDVEVPGWDGEDFGQLAAKLSEAAAQMSARIAEMIRGVDRSG
jgi:Uncharacterized protein conserved in bacteria